MAKDGEQIIAQEEFEAMPLEKQKEYLRAKLDRMIEDAQRMLRIIDLYEQAFEGREVAA